MTPKPSATNCPKSSLRAVFSRLCVLLFPCACVVCLLWRRRCSPCLHRVCYTSLSRLFGGWGSKVIPGGYCGGVPPLPIPNSEVKPACADGTAMQCGRVGDRPLSDESPPRGSMRRPGAAFGFKTPCAFVFSVYGGFAATNS